jgi:hypothetical protein
VALTGDASLAAARHSLAEQRPSPEGVVLNTDPPEVIHLNSSPSDETATVSPSSDAAMLKISTPVVA